MLYTTFNVRFLMISPGRNFCYFLWGQAKKVSNTAATE